MTEPIKLLPCPFCEGPPVPACLRGIGGGSFPDSEIAAAGDEGLYIKAHVFCHECGATSQEVTGFAFDREDANKLIAEAVAWWQARDKRHRDLYDSSDQDRLNLYPRPDAT